MKILSKTLEQRIEQRIEVPMGFRILNVQVRNDIPILWYADMLEDDNVHDIVDTVLITMLPTKAHLDNTHTYISTIYTDNNDWHVFWRFA